MERQFLSGSDYLLEEYFVSDLGLDDLNRGKYPVLPTLHGQFSYNNFYDIYGMTIGLSCSYQWREKKKMVIFH